MAVLQLLPFAVGLALRKWSPELLVAIDQRDAAGTPRPTGGEGCSINRPDTQVMSLASSQLLSGRHGSPDRGLDDQGEEQAAYGDGPSRGPASGADGVIIAQGGAFGGWALCTKDGKPTYCHNLVGLQRSKVKVDNPVPPARPPGTDGIRLRGRWPRQRRPGPPLHRRQPGRRGKLSATVPLIFSADETVDLGRDTGSPVSDDYTPATSVFTGTVGWVQIDVGAADADHFSSAEERFHIATARQ